MTQYRTATLAEIQLMLQWAEAEGWNPGNDDAAAFSQADKGGFFVAVDGQATPVGAISVVNHADDFAFLGLYIVLPQYRGQGIGLGLWRHALRHAAERTVGLDGVEDQQANYAASGFVHAGGTTRFTGSVTGQRHATVAPATADDMDALVALEATYSGVRKPGYLKAWFMPSDTRHTLVERGATGLNACCTVRRCAIGAKVGPLIAQDAASAERLLEHAASVYEGPLTIDVPDAAPQLGALCTALHLAPGFKTARMYRGPAPVGAKPMTFFAVASLELG